MSKQVSAGLLASAAILLIACALVVLRSDEPERTFIDLAEIVLDWPPLLVGLLVLLIIRFREEFAGLINRIRTVPTPWGQIDTAPQPSPPQGGEAPDADGSEDAVPNEGSVAAAAQPPSPVVQAELEQLRAALDFSNGQWFYWWAEYMFTFLIPATKAVIVWMAFMNAPISKDYYHGVWSPKLPISTQREGIINTLWNIEVVTRDPNGMQLTPTGWRMLQQFDDQHPGWRAVYAQFFPPLAPSS